jgi:hypothetical protein
MMLFQEDDPVTGLLLVRFPGRYQANPSRVEGVQARCRGVYSAVSIRVGFDWQWPISLTSTSVAVQITTDVRYTVYRIPECPSAQPRQN